MSVSDMHPRDSDLASPPMLAELVDDARRLGPIPAHAVVAYRAAIPLLKEHVDRRLGGSPEIGALLGGNPERIMRENHGHHAAFMATVLAVGDYELLATTIPWVYRTYHSQGLSFEYFPLELCAWIEAMQAHLDEATHVAIEPVYRWLLDHHEAFVTLAGAPAAPLAPGDPAWRDAKDAFAAALLAGDHRRCLEMSRDAARVAADVAPFYLQVLQPALYDVGMLWERGTLSVAQEHLASAIVGRVMANVSAIAGSPPARLGRAVVTAAANEYHELGAWMVADVLEQAGWDVRYLGANTPAPALVDLVRSSNACLLAVSVTMAFNVGNASELIAAVRQQPDLASRVKVMVGGQVFNAHPGLWRTTGADACAEDAIRARSLAAGWACPDGR